MRSYLLTAIILAAAATGPASADPTPTDAPAVLKTQAIRRAVEEKQQQLAEEKRVAAPAPATPAAPLDLPVDESDSPGATTK